MCGLKTSLLFSLALQQLLSQYAVTISKVVSLASIVLLYDLICRQVAVNPLSSQVFSLNYGAEIYSKIHREETHDMQIDENHSKDTDRKTKTVEFVKIMEVSYLLAECLNSLKVWKSDSAKLLQHCSHDSFE